MTALSPAPQRATRRRRRPDRAAGAVPGVRPALPDRPGRPERVGGAGHAGQRGPPVVALDLPDAGQDRPRHVVLQADPLEQNNIASKQPEVVTRLLQEYEAWFRDVRSTRNFAPPRIHLASPAEDPVTLTRQDWRGPETAWEPGLMGGWDVDVLEPRKFDIDLVFVQGPPGAAHFDIAGTTAQGEIGPGARSCRIENVEIPQGPARLRAWIDRPNGAVGVYQVILHAKKSRGVESP